MLAENKSKIADAAFILHQEVLGREDTPVTPEINELLDILERIWIDFSQSRYSEKEISIKDTKKLIRCLRIFSTIPPAIIPIIEEILETTPIEETISLIVEGAMLRGEKWYPSSTQYCDQRGKRQLPRLFN